MDFQEIIKKTRDAHAALEQAASKGFPIHAWMIDLMEETGELANAILVKEGYKTTKRQKAELGDSLADILFDLILIADQYGLDLEKEYLTMLEKWKARAARGEFTE